MDNNMRKPFFDRFYFVLLRYYNYAYDSRDWVVYPIPFIMSLLVMLNLVSIFVLFIDYIKFDWLWFLIVCLIVGCPLTCVFYHRYNKKKRAELRERYENEGPNTLRRDVIWFIIYLALTIVFLISSFCIAFRGIPAF